MTRRRNAINAPSGLRSLPQAALRWRSGSLQSGSPERRHSCAFGRLVVDCAQAVALARSCAIVPCEP